MLCFVFIINCKRLIINLTFGNFASQNLSASPFQRQEKSILSLLSNGRTVMDGRGHKTFATPTAVLMMGGLTTGIFIITGIVFILIAREH